MVMALQSVFNSHLSINKIAKYKAGYSNPHYPLPNVSPSTLSQCKNSRILRSQIQGARFEGAVKCHNVPFFHLGKSSKRQNIFSCLASSDTHVEASNSGENAKESSTKIATQEKSNSDVDNVVETFSSGENGLDSSTKIATQEVVKEVVFNEEEPFSGKSGSVSFSGLTHQLVEERKLVSSPFKDATGSLLWLLGPISLLSSLLLPQFFLSNIDAIFGSELLAEIVVSFTNEMIFYIGCAVFLLTTDRVQRPYLEFSAKRWSLITGLRGYLTSTFLVMGFKLFVPLALLYVVWPVIGIPAVLALAPFIIGCGIQTLFEAYLDRTESSCWPLVPIVFEIYRLYQLTRAAHFVQTMIFAMRESEMTPELVERGGALVSMVVVIQVLGVVCLWSLITFLLRLFPSRPVSENY